MPNARTDMDWPLSPQLDSGHRVATNRGWRTRWPAIAAGKCSKCGLCFVYCPDGAVAKGSDGMPAILSDWCKGCGLCAAECPKGAFEMRDEQAGSGLDRG